MNQYAVIVAGGQGLRMQSDLPKQFISIAGKPILMHTLQAFHAYQRDLPVILVLPEQEHARWTQLCKQYSFDLPHEVVTGGSCRPFSVRNGVRYINDADSLVAIHDGVRPLVSADLISRSFSMAEKYGSAIASVPLKDSIREMTPSGSQSRDRTQYRLMQTPQTFHTSLLLDAYRTIEVLEDFSDEASLVEAAGAKVQLIAGDYQNIKVTTPEDLKIAEAFLQ